MDVWARAWRDQAEQPVWWQTSGTWWETIAVRERDWRGLEELQVFEAQHEAGAYEDRRVRAQALLFLSRIRTELGAGAAAVRCASSGSRASIISPPVIAAASRSRSRPSCLVFAVTLRRIRSPNTSRP